jgi:hypothetical protein
MAGRTTVREKTVPSDVGCTGASESELGGIQTGPFLIGHSYLLL